jgi:hypothetical protein
MASSDERPPTTGRSSDDLTGLDILLVEDSWDVGQAIKALLELCGATVAGRRRPSPTLKSCSPAISQMSYRWVKEGLVTVTSLFDRYR